jgi:AGCS family alanine or glycine:cation symporter
MQIINIFITELKGAIDAFTSGLTSGSLDAFIGGLTALVWSPLTVLLLLCAGFYFSIKLRFVQLRKIRTMVRLLLTGSSSEEGISSFQAFALAVAGRVGTGNIMGVATAIAYGGPGALFWMWLIAFIGAGSAFVESTLAQLYKVEIDGEYRGGPAYYFGMRGYKIVSKLFMVACIIATGLLLPGIQSNSIVTSVNNAFNINPTVIIIFVLILVALIIFGGTKRLSRFAEIIVPFMSGIYILSAFIILIINIQHVPAAFALIFKSAFGQEAVIGATLGQAIMMGVKRGIFSNEAGQGTGPHAAAAAEVSHPAKQGLVQAFSVYFDTLLVCSATGLAIIITNSYSILIPGTADAANMFTTYPGFGALGGSPDMIPTYTSAAFSNLMGGFST